MKKLQLLLIFTVFNLFGCTTVESSSTVVATMDPTDSATQIPRATSTIPPSPTFQPIDTPPPQIGTILNNQIWVDDEWLSLGSLEAELLYENKVQGLIVNEEGLISISLENGDSIILKYNVESGGWVQVESNSLSLPAGDFFLRQNKIYQTLNGGEQLVLVLDNMDGLSWGNERGTTLVRTHKFGSGEAITELQIVEYVFYNGEFVTSEQFLEEKITNVSNGFTLIRTGNTGTLSPANVSPAKLTQEILTTEGLFVTGDNVKYDFSNAGYFFLKEFANNLKSIEGVTTTGPNNISLTYPYHIGMSPNQIMSTMINPVNPAILQPFWIPQIIRKVAGQYPIGEIKYVQIDPNKPIQIMSYSLDLPTIIGQSNAGFAQSAFDELSPTAMGNSLGGLQIDVAENGILDVGIYISSTWAYIDSETGMYAEGANLSTEEGIRFLLGTTLRIYRSALRGAISGTDWGNVWNSQVNAELEANIAFMSAVATGLEIERMD